MIIRSSFLVSLVAVFSVTVLRTGSAVEIHCKFSHDFDWFTVGKVYTCSVQQKLDALHSDSEVIQVFGDHLGKKQNKDVLAVRIHSRNIYYFSSGYERFFTHLQVIQVYASKLKFITQKDLRPFDRLKHIDLNRNDLEVLEKELFKFNPELEVVKVSDNRLRFIDVTAFEGLFKLHTLELNGNHCIWKATAAHDDLDEDEEISREEAIDVMYEARTRCYRDYILKELLDMEMGRNLRERSVLVTKLESRIEDLVRQNDLFYDRMRSYKDQLDACQSKEINMHEAAAAALAAAAEANVTTTPIPPTKNPDAPAAYQPPKNALPSQFKLQFTRPQQEQLTRSFNAPREQFLRPNQLQMAPSVRGPGAGGRFEAWEREGRSTHDDGYGYERKTEHRWRH